MNGLQTAQAALETELKRARAGAAHYQARAAKLAETIAALAAIEAPAATAASPAAKPTAARLRTKAKKRAVRAKKPGAAPQTAASELPFTGGDFWINLIGNQPKSARDILKAAVDSLSFTPTKDQVKKLSSRMIFTLRTLIHSKKIQDAGSGRNRQYFKKA